MLCQRGPDQVEAKPHGHLAIRKLSCLPQKGGGAVVGFWIGPRNWIRGVREEALYIRIGSLDRFSVRRRRRFNPQSHFSIL